MIAQIDEARLAELQSRPLRSGKHSTPEEGWCAVEAASHVAGERFSDHPACVCPVIAAFVRQWNDGLPSDEDRTRLLLPLVPRIIGTRAGVEIELRRSFMAIDWIVRTYAPAWLDLVPSLSEHALALRALPELADGATVEAALVALNRAQTAARTASGVVRNAAWDAAWDAARAAGSAAAWAAAWAVASAAWDAGSAAPAAAWGAARDAAWAVASDATRAWTAEMDAMEHLAHTTVAALQTSAFELLDRMISAGESTP